MVNNKENIEEVKIELTSFCKRECIHCSSNANTKKIVELSFEKLQAKKPEEIINHAVKGMLPKGKLGRQMFKKLKVYVGPEHAHAAQKPETLEF